MCCVCIIVAVNAKNGHCSGWHDSFSVLMVKFICVFFFLFLETYLRRDESVMVVSLAHWVFFLTSLFVRRYVSTVHRLFVSAVTSTSLRFRGTDRLLWRMPTPPPPLPLPSCLMLVVWDELERRRRDEWAVSIRTWSAV